MNGKRFVCVKHDARKLNVRERTLNAERKTMKDEGTENAWCANGDQTQKWKKERFRDCNNILRVKKKGKKDKRCFQSY